MTARLELVAVCDDEDRRYGIPFASVRPTYDRTMVGLDVTRFVPHRSL